MLPYQILLLPDLTKVILRDYLLPIGIVKLQRKVKKTLQLKKSGFRYRICDDCGAGSWNKPNYLEYTILIECCASPDCCHKYVCAKGCKIKCCLGHANINFDSDKEFVCRACLNILQPYRHWNGISQDEYQSRYMR